MTDGRKLAGYRHKVDLAACAPAPVPGATFAEWFERLPGILAGGDTKEVVDRWIDARRAGRPVVLAFGAHVIKAGLSRWLITLMEEGLVTRLAINGAVAIHDFELAAAGHTSEDVGAALAEGVFGRAEETARYVNDAAAAGASMGIGLGEALCRSLAARDLPHADWSVLRAALRIGVPVTVHVALGTDTVHTHPSADGRALGETSLRDFRDLAAAVRQMDGGLFVNAGSAVILPEIFLKAVSMARADGIEFSSLTTVVLDFIRQYRPSENVSRRPVAGGGRGFYLVGHHEILVPLLGQALLDRWRTAG
jgi:hypothetical protein